MANLHKQACENNPRAVEIANLAKAGENEGAHILLLEQVWEIWKKTEPVDQRIRETNQLFTELVCLDPKDIKIVQAKGGAVDLCFQPPKADPTDKRAKVVANLLAQNKTLEAVDKLKSYRATILHDTTKTKAQRELEYTHLGIDLKCLDPKHVSIRKIDNRGMIQKIGIFGRSAPDPNESTPVLKT